MRMLVTVTLLVATACTRVEPIAFDASNDAHCALAFLETEGAAREGGGNELALNMAFRAQWAQERANAKGLAFKPGQEVALNKYLRSGARQGAEAAIACRHRQNQDPAFPRSQVPYDVR